MRMNAAWRPGDALDGAQAAAALELTISGSMARRRSLPLVDSYRRTSLLSPLQQQTHSGFHGQKDTPRRFLFSIRVLGLRSCCNRILQRVALDSGFDARVRGAEHAVRRVHAAAMLGNAPPDGDHCRAAAATHAAARMSSSFVCR